MLLSVTSAILGLMLLNISWNSLKRSAVRKWRQGFTITLIIGLLIMVHGLVGMVIEMPLMMNNLLLFLAFGGMTFSVFLISKIQGLNA